MESVKILQKYLVANGKQIVVDGDLGKNTRGAIASLNIPSYLKLALGEVGVQEIRGSTHSKRVLEYHAVSGGFSTDEVPWCGSFINWVMLRAGHTTVGYPARAKSWLTFGKSSGKPTVGAIAVKSRTGGGHVCFVIGEDALGNLYCLGGNQNDEVNIKLYPKNAFLDFRIPSNLTGQPLNKYALNSSSPTKES